jgi:hypothetical protein
LKPYRTPPPTLSQPERQQVYNTQCVQQHWYGLTVENQPMMNLGYWRTLQGYFLESGDPAAAQQMEGWKHITRWYEVLYYAGVPLLAGGIIAGAMNKDDENVQRIAGPTAVSGLAALMACFGLQVIGDALFTQPAVEHFNQFLKNDLQFSAGARSGTLQFAGTLRY